MEPNAFFNLLQENFVSFHFSYPNIEIIILWFICLFKHFSITYHILVRILIKSFDFRLHWIRNHYTCQFGFILPIITKLHNCCHSNMQLHTAAAVTASTSLSSLNSLQATVARISILCPKIMSPFCLLNHWKSDSKTLNE